MSKAYEWWKIYFKAQLDFVEHLSKADVSEDRKIFGVNFHKMNFVKVNVILVKLNKM